MTLFSCKDTDTIEDKTHLERPLPANMQYTYDCLSGAANNDIITRMQQGGDMLRDMTVGNIAVTDAEQNQMGDDLLADIRKGNTDMRIDTQDPINAKLQSVLQDLLRKRIKPGNIRYEIFLLDDTKTINAFTFGGKIFITKAMYNRCAGHDDQLYAVVGHEIGHNEKGHIKKTIQELKGARQIVGDYGDGLVGISKMVGAVFNQKDEVEADYYRLDLVYMLGRDPCDIIPLWKSMAQDEGDYNKLQDFMRSHPYSSHRAECLTRHIAKNFDMNCK